MIRGLIFDINGTLSDIWTDEESLDAYRMVSVFLDYQGVKIPPEKVKELYFEINKRQRADSDEPYPEFDIVALFAEMIDGNASDFTRALPKKKRKLLPAITAEVFRAASRRQLQLYPDVKKTLNTLGKKYRLAAVSDGQSQWARAELASVGLNGCFHPFIVSGDYGYRKPDERLFKKALKKLDMTADEVVFVGNDMYRDVFGADQLGIKTVLFRSNQGEQEYCGTKADAEITAFSQLPAAIKTIEKSLKK